MNNIHSKIIRTWCFYDWGNSAFATTMMAAVLPVFFRQVSASNLPASQHALATSYWGYTASLAMLITACLSLVLGTLADYSASKRKYLTIFTLLGAIASSLLGLTGFGDWLWVSLLFMLGSIGFSGGEVFYDAFLPYIAAPNEVNRVSTRAYSYGYLGGGLLLAINILMIFFLPSQTSPAGEQIPALGMRLSFVTVGFWWLIFATPFLINAPELGIITKNQKRASLRIAFERLASTFGEIKKYKQIFLFILAFWMYNDGIGTIIKMATAYGDEIGISTMDLIGALLVTQFIGFPCAWLYGHLADRIGAKRGILLGLFVYILITIGGFYMRTAWHFWALAATVGVVQGGTQALSRAVFATMIPKGKSAEFFSFYNISGKFAGVVGPAMFALAGQIFGNSRYGILSLLFFFIAGSVLLMKVKIEAVE